MKLQEITNELQVNLRHLISCEDRRNAYGVAFFLDKVNIFLKNYIILFNEQHSAYPEMQFSPEEIVELDNMLGELSGNFFPMAHTNAPLGALQITNREEINSELQTIENLHRHMEHLLRDIGQLVKQAAEAENRLNQLANP